MKFFKVREVKSPTRGTSLSAGIDFYCPVGKDYVLFPHADVLIPSGIKVKVPKGHALIAFNKSGVASTGRAKLLAGLSAKSDNPLDACPLLIGACVIDEDYQGEIHIHLVNTGDEKIIVRQSEKIAQFILIPVNYAMPEEVDSLEALYSEKTERGENGFGSTN